MAKEMFHNRIAPKEKRMGRDFAAPSKEGATTGRFMSAGDGYGVGFRQPVGKEKASNAADPIPRKAMCASPEGMFGTRDVRKD